MPRILLALVAALPLLASIPLPPAPTRYVTDAASVIPDDRESALNARLEQHDRETSNQILVYVAHKVPAGTTLEEMGAEAIRTWRVGQKGKDNGAILFLFVDDRQSRIEAGYGLEGTLTDARSKDILVELRPLLQAADYAGATELATNRIIETTAGPPAPSYSPEQIDRLQKDAIAERNAELAARDEKLLIPTILFGIALFSFFFYALYRAFIVGDWKFGGSGGSSRGGSSSSSSSSGFSGGGGSGGGGGASDRW